MRGGGVGGVDLDENDLSKDGENSLSQSLFDDQTSSRTRKRFYFSLTKKKKFFFLLIFSINWSKNE